MKNKFPLLLSLCLMVITGTSGVHAQQAYPNKPIRFVTPFAPGGATTILARMLGQRLTEAWGQQVLVDNRPGGNTVIGTEVVARSPADGYTIILISAAHVIIPQLIATSFDPIKDFAPVATVAGGEFVLVLSNTVPANTVQELIALAKAKPGQLNYATSGSGSATHLASELLNLAAGVQIQHIPYKGSGQVIPDLVGGQVQMAFNQPVAFVPLIKAGKLKAIAESGQVRMAGLPQVPTFAESGLAGIDVNFWQGVLAPAGTPRPIVDKLSAEITKILSSADIREKMVGQGTDPFISTPEQFSTLLRADFAKYGRIIKAANIKLDD